MPNPANCITLSRIALVAVFTIAVTIVPEQSWGYYLALFSFLLAAVSDWLDGYVARKYNMVTTFGKLIDPLADKIAVSAAFIYLSSVGMCPVWATIIIISREFLVTGIRQIAQEQGAIIAADKTGKLKTCFQLAFCTAGLLALAVQSTSIPQNNLFQTFIQWCDWRAGNSYLANFTFWGAVLLTVYSGVSYALQSRNYLKQ